MGILASFGRREGQVSQSRKVAGALPDKHPGVAEAFSGRMHEGFGDLRGGCLPVEAEQAAALDGEPRVLALHVDLAAHGRVERGVRGLARRAGLQALGRGGFDDLARAHRFAPPRYQRLATVVVERPGCPACNGVRLLKCRAIADQGDGSALAWVRCLACACRFKLLME